MTGNAGGRLARLEDAMAERAAAKGGGPGIIVLIPDESWTAEDRARYAAGGEAMADVIEERTGQRPGATTIVITMAERADGPQ